MRVGLCLLLSLALHVALSAWLSAPALSRASSAGAAVALRLPVLSTAAKATDNEQLLEQGESTEPVVEPLPEPSPAASPSPPVKQAAKAESSAAQSAVVKPKSAVKTPPVEETLAAIEPVTKQQQKAASAASALAVESSTDPAMEPMSEVVSETPRFREPPEAPDYPARARRLNQQGQVLLEVRLDASGNQREVQLVRSSGFTSLDQAAAAAVADWKFQPELRNGQPQPSRVQIPIDFALNKRH